MPEIQRRKTPTVRIGQVKVGWEVPVVVQSMTNTDTADVQSTIDQVAALALAGSEIVRVTVNNEDAAAAVPAIVEGLDKRGITVPIVGDFHYNGHILLKKFPATARALSKYRINPGNASIGKKDNDNFQVMVECAVENQKPVRIGVNWGSLDQALLTRMMDENSKSANPQPARDVMMEAMVVSALDSAKAAERYGLRDGPDHPLRQGLRRPRPHRRLHHSRLALPLRPAPRPHRSRHGRQGPHRFHRRPRAAAAGRHRRHHPRQPHAQARRRPHRGSPGRAADPAVARDPQLHAPGHELPRLRSNHFSTYFQELAEQIQGYLRASMPEWRKKYAGVEELKLAVMGCVVNGPGESKHANLGISLPGTFEEPKAPVYVDGKLLKTLHGDTIVAEFKEILDKYVESHYGKKSEELAAAH